MALQMAFKAINDTIGLDSLIFILLVYSAYPQITEYNPLLLLITKRALAIKKAIAKVQKLKAKR
jgi:F0F1-type ATP synthase membrane subunit b/b'